MIYIKFIFINILLLIVVTLGLDNDLSLFEFTKDGNVAQLLYSGIAIEKYGFPIVGIYISKLKISILLSGLFTYNKLMEPNDNDDDDDDDVSDRGGVYIQDHSCLAVTGYHPDVIPVQNHINRVIQSHRYNYGEIPSMHHIATQSMEYITQGVYRDAADEAASRPLAVSVIIASSKGIMVSEPMSKINKYKFLCRGNFLNKNKSNKIIEKIKFFFKNQEDRDENKDKIKDENKDDDEHEIIDEISNVITEIASIIRTTDENDDNDNNDNTNTNTKISSLRCAVVSACKNIDIRGSNEIDVIQLSKKDALKDSHTTRAFIKIALTQAIKM